MIYLGGYLQTALNYLQMGSRVPFWTHGEIWLNHEMMLYARVLLNHSVSLDLCMTSCWPPSPSWCLYDIFFSRCIIWHIREIILWVNNIHQNLVKHKILSQTSGVSEFIHYSPCNELFGCHFVVLSKFPVGKLSISGKYPILLRIVHHTSSVHT